MERVFQFDDENRLIEYTHQNGFCLVGHGSAPICPDWEEEVWGWNRPLVGLKGHPVLFILSDTRQRIGAMVPVERLSVQYERDNPQITNTGLITEGQFKNGLVYTVNRKAPKPTLVFGRWKDYCETCFDPEEFPIECLSIGGSSHRASAKSMIE